ncbi:MAG: phosphoribosylamine--glycine ligase [Actinomycetota bacterium]
MRVLVVGGGGREHAIVHRLSSDESVDQILAAPGNAGIEQEAKCLPISADDTAGLVSLAMTEKADLVVVGPEAPLVAGLADELASHRIPVFGPQRDAARLEGSKSWARDFCTRHQIPSPRARMFKDVADGTTYLDELDPPYVVKADGLAAGKGVTIAPDRETAVAALEACLLERAFGDAGELVLIEEHLSGQEISALALTDGREVLPLALAQDFKRIGDGDTGPNTGGMGAYSPVPFVDEDTSKAITEDVLFATVRGLANEGIRYRGVLYAGLMLTDSGPRVLEFNCRFGDPETQSILPRLRGDLGELLLASATGNLSGAAIDWNPDPCVTVTIASAGYPGEYRTGFPIDGLQDASSVEGVTVFHAGAALRDGRVVTAGGRVLSVSALGASFEEARARVYEACSLISFEGMQYRTDIAARVQGAEF